jgi:hypothetical protein
MIIFLPTFILLTIAAFSINRAIQKTPKVQPKEGTVEDPKSPTLHQDLIQLSRIRNTYGEATATLVSKHHVNNRGTNTAEKSQTLRNNRTSNNYTRDEDNNTFIYDLDYALVSDYDLNSKHLSHSDTGSNQDHSCHDSGHSHSSHNYGSSHDYGGHDCGGHDFGGFDCGSD